MMLDIDVMFQFCLFQNYYITDPWARFGCRPFYQGLSFLRKKAFIQVAACYDS